MTLRQFSSAVIFVVVAAMVFPGGSSAGDWGAEGPVMLAQASQDWEAVGRRLEARKAQLDAERDAIQKDREALQKSVAGQTLQGSRANRYSKGMADRQARENEWNIQMQQWKSAKLQRRRLRKVILLLP